MHVLASLPLTMTPVSAIHRLKGYTARCLFLELPKLRKLYKKGHLWSTGKFMGSVGHITLEKAKQYLEAHHAKAIISGIPARSEAEGRPIRVEPSDLGGRQVETRILKQVDCALPILCLAQFPKSQHSNFYQKKQSLYYLVLDYISQNSYYCKLFI